MNEFSVYLNNYMTENNLTQKELADRLGMTQSGVNRYVTGKRTPTKLNQSKMKMLLSNYLSSPEKNVKKSIFTENSKVIAVNLSSSLNLSDEEHSKLKKVIDNPATKALLFNYIDKLEEVL